MHLLFLCPESKMSSIVQLSLGDVQDYQKLANAIERHEQLREVPLDMESVFFLQLVDVVFRKSIAVLIFLELGETQPKSENNIIVLYYCNYIAIFLSQLLFKLYSYISYNYCYKIILVVQLVIAESMVCGL